MEISYEKKKEAVVAQYFKQYLDSIFPAINLYNELVPRNNNGIMNVMHTMFLCSVIDHFGKVLRVGGVSSDLPLKRGQNENNFVYFISEFFPSDQCKGDILYKLFRNGVMHQFYPKAAGVFWSNDVASKDILLDEFNAHPRLNNYALSNYIESALHRISESIENDTMKNEIEAMYHYLVENNYGFNDHVIFENLKATYSAQGMTLYDSCKK